jgi:23S rRNA pseudouridine955/2504/2580 synthase
LQSGDQIRVPPVRLPEADAPERAPQSLLERIGSSIIFEDKLLLVLDKPSGIATHGGSGVSFGAIELLRQLRPEEPLELVHRLDRDTSGLLVLAKKRSALTELQGLIRAGKLEKRYLTLLLGDIGEKSRKVDVPLRKFQLQGGERMVRVDPEGKPSVSHFKRLQLSGGHSFVEVKIDTGRTHQIRVHSQHLGHPVAGDEKYGEREANRALREQAGLKRLFLHAASLRFALKDGSVPYVLNAPLAEDLRAALDRLV